MTAFIAGRVVGRSKPINDSTLANTPSPNYGGMTDSDAMAANIAHGEGMAIGRGVGRGGGK